MLPQFYQHLRLKKKKKEISQNHRSRMGQAGRDGSGSSGPTSMPEQDHPRARATGLHPDGS